MDSELHFISVGGAILEYALVPTLVDLPFWAQVLLLALPAPVLLLQLAVRVLLYVRVSGRSGFADPLRQRTQILALLILLGSLNISLALCYLLTEVLFTFLIVQPPRCVFARIQVLILDLPRPCSV